MERRSTNHTEVRQQLGSRIRAARESAGLTQRQLAECVGVARSQVSAWENGHSPMYVEDLVLLARSCHLTPGELWKQPPPAGQQKP